MGDGSTVPSGFVYSSGRRRYSDDPENFLEQMTEVQRSLFTKNVTRILALGLMPTRAQADELGQAILTGQIVADPPKPKVEKPRAPRKPKSQNVEHVVYVIKFAGRVKIGTTGNLKRRLSGLPYDEVLCVVPGSYALEARDARAVRSSANQE